MTGLRLIKALDGKYVVGYKNVNLAEFETKEQARNFILETEFGEATQDWIDGMIEARDIVEQNKRLH